MNAMARKRPREILYPPTLQTLEKLELDVLLGLVGSEQWGDREHRFTTDDERAGREIVDIHRAVKSALFRTQRMGGGGGGLIDPTDALTQREARIHAKRYLPWSRKEGVHLVSGWPRRLHALDLVLAVCDDNVSLTELARRHDMNDQRMYLSFLRPIRSYVALMRFVKVD